MNKLILALSFSLGALFPAGAASDRVSLGGDAPTVVKAIRRPAAIPDADHPRPALPKRDEAIARALHEALGMSLEEWNRRDPMQGF